MIDPLLAAEAADERKTFEYWYPTWDAWKFRRTLSRAPSGNLARRRRAEVPGARRYWVAILFLEGSALFVVGASFAMTRFGDEAVTAYALVATPYLAGGLCFTLGAYAGVVEVINVSTTPGDKVRLWFSCRRPLEEWRALRKHVGWEPLAGYSCYIVGAVAFNVAPPRGTGTPGARGVVVATPPQGVAVSAVITVEPSRST